jgi:hypothetical protein
MCNGMSARWDACLQAMETASRNFIKYDKYKSNINCSAFNSDFAANSLNLLGKNMILTVIY